MSNRYPFLGTGWGFPPEFSKKGRSVAMTSDEEDIGKSLEILFSTSLGERIMEPAYGCDLKRFLFEPIDTAAQTYVKDLVKTAILYHEARIVLDDVTFNARPAEGAIEITVSYTIRATNSRHNYVYPFYINEGAQVSK